MQKSNFILMADIVNSSQQNQQKLMKEFEDVVQSVFVANKKKFLSPPTITLGDEFQSVVVSLAHCCKLLFAFEEEIISKGYQFKMRYVVNEGAINTPINKKTAYGMMGEGLTDARKTLTAMKKSKIKYQISVADLEKKYLLNNLFYLTNELEQKWKHKDYQLIAELLKQQDYKQVANTLNKDVSLVWRRKKSLGIETYQVIKNSISFVAEHE